MVPLTQMAIEVLPSAGAVAERAASLLAAALLNPASRPTGLATGRTMEPVYAALVPLLQGNPALARWRSFNLDEYVGLSPQDPRSFAAFMQRHLGGPLELAPGALALPDGRAPDADAEALRYGQAVISAGVGLQLLGLGNNGHVGFNEPPCAPSAPCRCLRLSEATRQQNAGAFGGDPEAVPARAITLGMREILAAEELLLVVTGGAKSAVLKRLLQEPPGDALPASWLRQHRSCLVLCDQAAASGL